MNVNAKIIDADGHVRDRDADIRAHMEEPWNQSLINISEQTSRYAI